MESHHCFYLSTSNNNDDVCLKLYQCVCGFRSTVVDGVGGSREDAGDGVAVAEGVGGDGRRCSWLSMRTRERVRDKKSQKAIQLRA